MIIRVHTLVSAVLVASWTTVAWTTVAWTQDVTEPQQRPRRNIVADRYFAPDLVLKNEERLGLTADQKSAVEGLLAEAQSEIKGAQQKLQGDRSDFGDTVDVDPGDETAILAKMKTVLHGETDIKIANLMLLVNVYNVLNSDQRTELQTIKQERIAAAKELQQRIQQKVQTVQQLIQQQAQAGQPPRAVIEMMQPFGQLVRSRQGAKAEALLDEALEQLEANQNAEPIDVGELFK